MIGDSILKHVQGYEISKSLENCKTYVKSFSGAKIRDMRLRKTNVTREPRPNYYSCRDKRFMLSSLLARLLL